MKMQGYNWQKRGQGVEKQENCTKSFPFLSNIQFVQVLESYLRLLVIRTLIVVKLPEIAKLNATITPVPYTVGL